MLGLEHLRLQSEHYNHTNCTFLPDGRWRGQQHAAGIGWVWGSQMLGGSRLSQLDPLARPKELPVKEGFSMTPAPSVAWVGASVVITVAVLYVIFW